MIIIGIDPGTTRVGYGVIKKEGDKLLYVKSGLVDIPSNSVSQKLLDLEKALFELVKEIRPDKAAIEKVFFSPSNKKTALQVAQARGIIISVIVKQGIKIYEPSPTEVKLAVTGNGRASKNQVAKMVSYFLGISTKNLVDDVVDALAVAITASGNKTMEEG